MICIHSFFLYSKPPKDVLAEYTKRAAFLNGIVQTATLNSPIEKVKKNFLLILRLLTSLDIAT